MEESMVGFFRAPHILNLSPHKVSISILIQVFSTTPLEELEPPVVPIPFSTVPQHNAFGLFLLSIANACDDILEPKLEELLAQLESISGMPTYWLSDHLIRALSSFSTPNDLFYLFMELRIITGSPDRDSQHDTILLDMNSNLGMFLRRCVLAFDFLSFEGVCRLLSNIQAYCKGTSSHSRPSYYHNDNRNSAVQGQSDAENMDVESGSDPYELSSEETERHNRIPFHLFLPKTLTSVPGSLNLSGGEIKISIGSIEQDTHESNAFFLRTDRQVQGYLSRKAEEFHKNTSTFPLSQSESILTNLQKSAPEFHRVHFMRFLAALSGDDYSVALENLLRYFDYTAGTEGLDPNPSRYELGRHELALLYTGMMHFHFGHPKPALEALTEAVMASQQHKDDACLAHTLLAISDLLSEIAVPVASGIFRSPVSGTGVSLSVSAHHQIPVLLRRSLGIAETLKLKHIKACTHLAMARFELVHVHRPLLSFGPEDSVNPATSPANACRELRLCSRLINELDAECAATPTVGAHHTNWLTNLNRPLGSSIFDRHGDEARRPSTLFSYAAFNSLPSDVMRTLGSAYSVRTTAWEMYGSAPLARANAVAHITCFARDSTSADLALSYAKLVQRLALFEGYREAFAALSLVEEKFASDPKSPIHVLRLQLHHDQALHIGHLNLALRLCDELGAIARPVNGVDTGFKAETGVRRARTLLALRQYGEAAAVAHSVFCACYGSDMQVENATVLLLLADIYLKSGNPVVGIPYALASLSFCDSYNLDLMRACSLLSLAELWLSSGPDHAKMALALVHASFPMVLGHGGLELRARAYIAEAKCCLADPEPSFIERPDTVLGPLGHARAVLKAMGYHEMELEVFYLLAIVHERLGNVEERDIAADSFRRYISLIDRYKCDDL